MINDKPIKIKYIKTHNNYMCFKNLNEYPSLNDIKYLIEHVIIHFINTNNMNRKNEIINFLYVLIKKYDSKSVNNLKLGDFI